MKLERTILRARTQLILRHPFWGQLALHLNPKESKDVPTAATDGKRLYYNRKWLLKQLKIAAGKSKFMEFLYAHELGHIIHDSFRRKRARNSTLWNLATDFGINGELYEEFYWVPDQAAYSRQFINWPHERIYNHLVDNTEVTKVPLSLEGPNGNEGNGKKPKNGQSDKSKGKQPNKQPSSSNGDTGKVGTVTKYKVTLPDGTVKEFEEWDVHMPTSKSGKKGEEDIERWKGRAIQAAQAAKMRGDLPGSIGKLIEKITNPVLPWQAILADFVTDQAREDYSWNRPDPVMLQSDMLLPTLNSQQMNIAVAIDTSGSISKEEAEIFMGELVGITSAFPGSKVHTYFCDAAVHYTQVIHDFHELDINTAFEKGGGGTDFCPVFNAIEEDDLVPGCLVYLTDGYGSYPTKCYSHNDAEEPMYPTLWIINNDRYDTEDVPFGRTTQLLKGT